MVRVLSRFVAFACITATMTGCTVSRNYQPFDASKLVLLQYQDMVPGEDIAVVQTSLGEFSLRFFPSEAPKTVENFIQLAQQGYFDGERIARVEHTTDQNGNPAGRMIAGTKGSADQPGKSIYHTAFKEEISYNLAHFPGAVSAYCPDGEVDSRFFIVGTHPVAQSQLQELRANNYPKQIVERFQEEGGYPDYWLQSAIFAQVISGMPVVDQILESPEVPEDQQTEIKILKVDIQKYE